MQTLGDFNPASHLVWLVGGGMMILLAIALLLEAVDWLRDRASRRGHEAASADTGWRLTEPETRMRDRHFRRGFARWYWPRSDHANASNLTLKRSSHLGGPKVDAEGASPISARTGKFDG